MLRTHLWEMFSTSAPEEVPANGFAVSLRREVSTGIKIKDSRDPFEQLTSSLNEAMRPAKLYNKQYTRVYYDLTLTFTNENSVFFVDACCHGSNLFSSKKGNEERETKRKVRSPSFFLLFCLPVSRLLFAVISKQDSCATSSE